MLFPLIAFELNDNYNFFLNNAFNTFNCPYFRTRWSPQLRWGFRFLLFILSISSRWTPSLISRLTFQQRFIPPNFNGKTMNMRILSHTISKYLLMCAISFSSRHVISPSLQTQACIYYSWWPARLPSSQLCGLLCPDGAEFIVTFNDSLINLEG